MSELTRGEREAVRALRVAMATGDHDAVTAIVAAREQAGYERGAADVRAAVVRAEVAEATIKRVRCGLSAVVAMRDSGRYADDEVTTGWLDAIVGDLSEALDGPGAPAGVGVDSGSAGDASGAQSGRIDVVSTVRRTIYEWQRGWKTAEQAMAWIAMRTAAATAGTNNQGASGAREGGAA